MALIRRALVSLVALFVLWTAPMAPTLAADAAAVSAQAQATPRTDGEIRQWYNDQVATIPTLDQQWRQQGLSAEARARKAHEIRHDARLRARSFMQDRQAVADLQARDQEKYGNPDGPTFEYLVDRNREKGLTDDAAYEDIVGSSRRTDRGYNEKFNVRPAGQGP